MKEFNRFSAVLLSITLMLSVFAGSTVAAKAAPKLNKTSAKLVEGQSITLKMKNVSKKKVTWKTSNKKVATVSKGVVKAVKKGNATITAKVAKKSYKCKVTVFAKEEDASDFVLLSDAVPDAILEIRYYSTYNFIGDRIDGYEEPVALLTKEAASALKKISDNLKAKGYRLKIYDAYRPQKAVNHFMRWAKDATDTRMKQYFYPDLEKTELFPLGYIAEHSGHSKGSTVDLTLFDMKTEKEVDMGGTFDFFGELSHPDYRGITDEQYNNRMILREAMIDGGFDPLPEEWWHFTLKDQPYPDTYFTFPVRKDVVGKMVSSAGATSTNPVEETVVDVASPEWVTKIPAASKCDQLCVVVTEKSEISSGWFTFHKKDKNGKWRMRITTPCFIGKNGLGKTKEGDLMTPVGTFTFTDAFGLADDPGCKMKYVKATDNTWWSGDPNYMYNKLIEDSTKHPGLDTSKCDEHIVDYPFHYQYCLNISYNKEGTPGLGSGIFLHCFGPGKPWTGGCIAIPFNKMKYIMTQADEKTNVVIDTIDNLGGTWPPNILS